jgi:hypothetical protein
MNPNPTPQSPIQVEKNPEYEIMTDYAGGSYYPSAAEVIVRHKKSGTYWKAIYRVREDDSDADWPATWRRVVPKKMTVTKYENV